MLHSIKFLSPFLFKKHRKTLWFLFYGQGSLGSMLQNYLEEAAYFYYNCFNISALYGSHAVGKKIVVIRFFNVGGCAKVGWFIEGILFVLMVFIYQAL